MGRDQILLSDILNDQEPLNCYNFPTFTCNTQTNIPSTFTTVQVMDQKANLDENLKHNERTRDASNQLLCTPFEYQTNIPFLPSTENVHREHVTSIQLALTSNGINQIISQRLKLRKNYSIQRIGNALQTSDNTRQENQSERFKQWKLVGQKTQCKDTIRENTWVEFKKDNKLKKRSKLKPWMTSNNFIIHHCKKRFRQGRIFNCDQCGDFYDKDGHCNNPYYHYACCELCGKSKNHWNVRDIYFCSCTDPTCKCPKGKSGRCKRGICGVCLFEKSNCISKLTKIQDDSGVLPGNTSFKKYLQRIFYKKLDQLNNLEDLRDSAFEWKHCCQCIAHRMGVEYGDICPCTYHTSLKHKN